jgi:hypothetical protein
MWPLTFKNMCEANPYLEAFVCPSKDFHANPRVTCVTMNSRGNQIGSKEMYIRNYTFYFPRGLKLLEQGMTSMRVVQGQQWCKLETKSNYSTCP